jgi:hypothetical protein
VQVTAKGLELVTEPCWGHNGLYFFQERQLFAREQYKKRTLADLLRSKYLFLI